VTGRTEQRHPAIHREAVRIAVAGDARQELRAEFLQLAFTERCSLPFLKRNGRNPRPPPAHPKTGLIGSSGRYDLAPGEDMGTPNNSVAAAPITLVPLRALH
jgi:hypothetical protein